jgi:fructokinase
MSTPLVVGLGEAVWDIFETDRKPGGATANVAFHAAQLGARGVVASRVGTDELGQELTRYLVQKGLDITWLQSDSQHQTGKVTVDATDPGHPTYVIHPHVAWDYLDPTPEFLQLADQAAAVCFGTLAQRSPASREAIQQFIARTKGLVVFDVNLRQQFYDRDSLDRSFQRASIVKLNLDEVPPVAAQLRIPGTSAQSFAKALLANYPIETLIITRAEHGCYVTSRGEEVDLPGESVTLVDAVGAGDAFTAAFLMLTLEGRPLELKARFANRVGALVVGHAGAMPPVGEQYRQLRTEFGI